MQLAVVWLCAFASMAAAQDLPTVKVGVLSYGTINWEIDTLKFHEIDKKYGINVETVKLTTKNAAAIAIQGRAVDVILTDLFWVIKQSGKFKMYPTHKLSGGVYASTMNTPLSQVSTLGVAGGANDKNLLVLLAYLKAQNQNLNAELKFGAPPLLNELMQTRKIDGLINFWHYNAKLDAAGFHNVLSTQSMLTGLGIEAEVPLLGWVFHREFIEDSRALALNFIAASNDAKKRMLVKTSTDWIRLKPKMRTKSEAEYLALINHYPNTILNDGHSKTKDSAMQLFSIVKGIKGQNLFKENEVFPENIFIDY